MTRAEEKFAEAFGIPPIESVTEKKELPAIIQDEPQVVDKSVDDFEFVRGTLYKLLENGSTAFEQLADIARVEEKIAAYTTMNEMLSNLSDISIKLLDIHEKKKKMEAFSKKDTPSQGPTNVTNNTVFVGSAVDLDKLLSQGDIIDV
jgi:hypothetical protein